MSEHSEPQAKGILVVDDDLALRAILSMTLESEGCLVSQAENVEQAKTHLLQGGFSLVLLDLGLPPNEHTPEQGIELLNWIVQQGYHLKVIVLTGQEDTAYACIKAGAFDYLTKPVSEAQLLNAVQRAQLFYQQHQRMQQQEAVQAIHINVPIGEGVKPVRNQAEETLVRQVLQATQFNINEAAKRLGLRRENIYYLMKKYDLNKDLNFCSDKESDE